MAEHHDVNRSSIVLYQGNGRSPPTLGRATLSSAGADFVIAVDRPAASLVAAPKHEVVTCLNNHTFLGTRSYRFTIAGGSDSEGDQAEARRLT